jgi:hypothetical protein
MNCTRGCRAHDWCAWEGKHGEKEGGRKRPAEGEGGRSVRNTGGRVDDGHVIVRADQHAEALCMCARARVCVCVCARVYAIVCAVSANTSYSAD